MDILTSDQRSKCMSRNPSKGTKPEIVVRRMTHRMGYRFRLHRKDLPGKPDLVFPARKKVIFVHGCFWHQHPNCRLASYPKSNQEYWIPKLQRNVERDLKHTDALEELGWQVLTIWECDVRKLEGLEDAIFDFMESRV